MKMKRTALILRMLVATQVFILASCGGGGSSVANGSSGESINGIAVPPAPDMAANNATLEGVDSNGNGVRDDVERTIAQAVKSQDSFVKSIALAKGMSLFATATSEMQRNEIDAIFRQIMCSDYYVYQDSGISIERIARDGIFNTETRRSAFERATANYGGLEGDANECK